MVGIGKMLDKALTASPNFGGHLGQPDYSLNRLNLTEKRSNAAKVVMPPMLEKPRRFGRHLPVIRTRQVAPLVYLVSKLIDDRRGVVLLLFGRNPLSFVKYKAALVAPGFALTRLRNRRDELRAATAL